LAIPPSTPVLTWPAPSAITYGSSLSAAQLNGSADVPGTSTYTPAAGTVLGAGLQTLSVTFQPDDTVDYNPATASVSLQVNQADPIITWPAPAGITFGTPLSATQLDATADVPGTFSYQQALGTVLGAGLQKLSVTFTPTDSLDFTTATASVPLAVSPVTPDIPSPHPA